MFGLFIRRRMENLMAASAHEDLPERDRAALDAWLAAHPVERANYERMRRVAQWIPQESEPLDRDLLAGVRARLAPAPARRFPVRRLAAAGVMTVAALVAVLAGPGLFLPAPPTVSEVAGVKTEESLIASAIDEADRLAAEHQYVPAFEGLSAAIAEHPGDPRAGEGQLRLADLAYAKLQWYDRAHDAYRRLAASYPETFTNSTDSVERMNILDEAREVNYASLVALEAARNERNADQRFARLESVVTDYAGTEVASLAATEMAAACALDGSGVTMAAMEEAIGRCASPLAAAQLNLELAQLHWRQSGDAKGTEVLLQKVAASGNQRLAFRADALRALVSARRQ